LHTKLAGYKINVQKSVAFPYTKNKLSKKEIMKTIPFTTASKEEIPSNKHIQGGQGPLQ
jgi:hypothetical protein